MSAMLASLRQIGRDLIEKRLWPVAVVLLAALVAAPMLIGSSSGGPAAPNGLAAAAPGAAGAAPPATPATAETTTTKTKPVKEKSGGKIDDPFFDPPSSPDEAAAGGGGAGGSARAVAASPTGEAAPRPGAASTKPKAEATDPQADPPAPKPATQKPRVTPAPAATTLTSSYLRTVVRVNGASGGKSHPMARLTPLGGTTHPAAVFLGVAKAGARYAVFLLGPRATSHGQATCKGDTDCRIIGLKAGETQVVTVRLPSGAVRRFSVHVGSIRKVGTSAARARAARAFVHPDGRRAVRVMRRHAATAAALRTARYDERAGLLRAAPVVVKSSPE